jgi:hypothetical protein
MGQIMKNMNELVAGVRTNNNKSDKAKEYAAASEWPKCQVAGCPLPTTIKEGGCTCGYHYKENGLSAECLTEAIKENLGLLKKYNSMLFWNVLTWKEKAPMIMGWPVLPATQDEINLPTIYLNRLKAYIDNNIKERASEIYQGNNK